MSLRTLRLTALIGLLVIVGAACMESDTPEDEAEGNGEVSLSIANVSDSVEGNVVSLPINIEGIDIKAADGDDSGESGHFHVFIDREPVEVGETIPVEAGVVHSAENPVKLYGLSPGSHEFTVVLGDGTHTRIEEEIEDSVTIDVEGPSVDGTAPATIEEGEDLTVELEAEGVEIKAADGDDSGDSGHFHVIVDPEEAPKAGDPIPAPVAGNEESVQELAEQGIFHTTNSEQVIEGLEAGDHVIWVVLGDGTHTAFDPAVMDRLTVTVS
jgi:hypothetical protein